MPQSVLILSSPADRLADLELAFRAETQPGCQVVGVDSLATLAEHLRADPSRPLVVVHERLGDGERSGLEVVPRVHEVDRYVPVVVVAEEGGVDSAARAIAAGATDFLVRGGRLGERIATLLGKLRPLFDVIARNRALDEQNARLRESIQARARIVGRSPQIQALIEQVRRVARVPRPLLLVGDRGTGKELVARAIHEAVHPDENASSPARPMIAVNCAAFSDSLLESELFGHEKGAFTGADSARRGKFEQADGGTLFLDEIGNMSLPFQTKILRVVEYGTFTRVGGTRELRTSARIVAATNTDLQERIAAGGFLGDLYDRLAFEVIRVPALRERSGDIEVLARHFLQEFEREIPAFRGKLLSRDAIDVLNSYGFPGNVRELKNIIERAAYRDTTNEITPEDIGMLQKAAVPSAPVDGNGTDFRDQVTAFERKLLSDALAAARGNQAEAARRLGLSYHQYRYYARKLEVS